MADEPGPHRLPSVSRLLGLAPVRDLLRAYPREVVVDAIREVLEALRGESRREEGPETSRDAWVRKALERIPGRVAAREAISLRRVVNATGVVVHTNLGRAPLAPEAIAALRDVSRGYSNLEYDLDAGRRSTRQVHAEELLKTLSGAESAHVVNNNAAAVLLCLAVLARGREVVVSRGELVEIGGSFRIPDVMAESGARLVEVGTTNRTRIGDYEKAISDRTALLLKVHRSNFRIVGFSEETPTSELCALGRRAGLPVMEDLGSGAFVDFAGIGIHGEPTVRQALARGPGIVTVSGDKLLGGSQAGIILGKRDLVDPLRRHPLARAMRIDKLCLAALCATLRLYSDGKRALERVPVLRMMAEDAASVRKRAAMLVRRIGKDVPARFAIVPGESFPGGGAMPEVGIPTACVAVSHETLGAEELDSRLRRGDPPVVGRIERGRLLLDLRTVGSDEIAGLASALRNALAGADRSG